MTRQTKQARIKELETEVDSLRSQIESLMEGGLSSDPPTLQAQVQDLGRSLAQATSLIQTQDGEIGRLTHLNDRMFRIIDKMITKEEPYGQQQSTQSDRRESQDQEERLEGVSKGRCIIEGE